MLVCPVCGTKAKKENQEFCLNCAWELEYYFSELSDDEKKRYKEKLKIAKKNYLNKTPRKKKTFMGVIFSLIKWILILIGISVVLFIVLAIFFKESEEESDMTPQAQLRYEHNQELVDRWEEESANGYK